MFDTFSVHVERMPNHMNFVTQDNFRTMFKTESVIMTVFSLISDVHHLSFNNEAWKRIRKHKNEFLRAAMVLDAIKYECPEPMVSKLMNRSDQIVKTWIKSKTLKCIANTQSLLSLHLLEPGIIRIIALYLVEL
jgi:hypothetical protein